jgi:hypothetical protein
MKGIVLAGTLLIIALQLVLAQTEKTAKDQNGSNVEAQIKTLADQGRESALKGDTSFVEKNTTSDYMAILPNGNMVGKAEVIQMRKNGDVKYESIDLSDQKVRTYGNTAVLNATANTKGTMKGNDISGTYHITQVWVKQGGGWKLANMQSTKVQQ